MEEQKLWTFEEMLDKVKLDISLDEEDPEEDFVAFDEFIGYFNEAIDEAEAEIMLLDEDYFLAYDYLAVVEDQSEYLLPANIYANKLRGVVFSNGSEIYPIKRYRRKDKFMNVAMTESFGEGDWYRYDIVNNSPGNRRMVLLPPARETAIIPPQATPFTPIRRWYIRQANRVPYTGEYTNREDILPTAVSAVANTIDVDPLVEYETGDEVKFFLIPGSGTLPGGLAVSTVYFVIAVSATQIKLATTAQNASLGTAIDLTSAGTGFFSMKVAATEAIINATVIDIPEFSTFIMEWVKANCLFKDGDPRLQGSVAKLEQQRTQMQATLANAEPDDDNTVEMDTSFYEDFN